MGGFMTFETGCCGNFNHRPATPSVPRRFPRAAAPERHRGEERRNGRGRGPLVGLTNQARINECRIPRRERQGAR